MSMWQVNQRSTKLTLALQVSLDFKLLLAFVFDALVVTLVCVASVLTDFVVIGVVAVASFTDHFTSVLLLVQLELGVRVDELGHVHDVLSSVLACRASIGGTEREADQVLGLKHATVVVFFGELNDAGASQVTDRVLGDEGHIALTIVSKVTGRFDDGGLGKHTGSQRRVSRNIARNEVGAGNRGNHSEDGGTEHHDSEREDEFKDWYYTNKCCQRLCELFARIVGRN